LGATVGAAYARWGVRHREMFQSTPNFPLYSLSNDFAAVREIDIATSYKSQSRLWRIK
jgi:hypothetical protein